MRVSRLIVYVVYLSRLWLVANEPQEGMPLYLIGEQIERDSVTPFVVVASVVIVVVVRLMLVIVAPLHPKRDLAI